MIRPRRFLWLIPALAAMIPFARLALEPSALIVDATRASVDRDLPADARAPCNDLTRLFLPHHARIAAEVGRSGHAPGWDPAGFGGRPLVGNPQAGLWYPPIWVAWRWFTPSALGWLTVGHLMFGGVGVYVMCRALRVSAFGSAAAGGLWATSPYVLAQAYEGHYPHVWAASIFPWTFWAVLCFRRGLHQPRLCAPRGNAALAALQTRSHAPGGNAVLAALRRLCSAWPAEGPQSGQDGIPTRSVGTRELAQWLIPPLLALSVLTGHAQEGYYLGLTLATWLAAEFSWRRWRNRGRRPTFSLRVAGLLALIAALSIGLIAVEIVPDWMAHALVRRGLKPTAGDASKYHVHLANLAQLASPFALGGPSSYRGPGSYWESLLSIGLVPLLLAIVGAAWSRNRGAAMGLSALAILSVLFAFGRGGLVFDAMFAVVPGMGAFRVPSRALFLASMAASAIAGMGVDAIARRGSGHRRLAIALALIAVAETSLYGLALIRVSPPERFIGPDPVGRAILAHRPAGPFRIRARDAFYGDARAFKIGLEKTNLNDSFQVGFAADLYERLYPMFGAPTPSRFPSRFRPDLQADILDRMNVAMLVSDRDDDRFGWPIAERGEWDGTRFTIRANPAPLPRAYVVPGATVVPDDPGMPDRFVEFPARETVLMARDPLPLIGDRQPFTPAEYVAHGPDRVEIDVTTRSPGLLVIGDTWAPGWSAELDGRPTAIFRGNRSQRVIVIAKDAGRHQIVMTYSPPGLAIGWWITIGAMAAWVGVVGVVVATNLTRSRGSPRSGIHPGRTGGRNR